MPRQKNQTNEAVQTALEKPMRNAVDYRDVFIVSHLGLRGVNAVGTWYDKSGTATYGYILLTSLPPNPEEDEKISTANVESFVKNFKAAEKQVTEKVD